MNRKPSDFSLLCMHTGAVDSYFLLICYEMSKTEALITYYNVTFLPVE